MIDAHTHLHWCKPAFRSLGLQAVNNIAVCATHPSDWKDVVDLWRQHQNKIVPFVGVHPWYVSSALVQEQESMAAAGAGEQQLHAADEDRLISSLTDRLEKILVEADNMGRIHVGEIGLDKMKAKRDKTKQNGFELQKKFFRAQLRLAARLGRGVQVHAVKANTALVEEYKALGSAPPDGTTGQRHGLYPPFTCLHSYSCGADMVEQLYAPGILSPVSILALPASHKGDKLYIPDENPALVRVSSVGSCGELCIADRDGGKIYMRDDDLGVWVDVMWGR